MAKLFGKIFLCILIKSLIVFSANGTLHKSPDNNLVRTEVVLNDKTPDSRPPLLLEGTPEGTTFISVNGTIKTIRDHVLDKNNKILTPVSVHSTLEDKTYLLVNHTVNDKTDILVYTGIDNTTTYLQAGTLKTSTDTKPTVKTFPVEHFQDAINAIPTNLVEPLSDDSVGEYAIDVDDAVQVACQWATVKFLLYTRFNPNFHQELNLNDNSISQSFFNASKNTTILVGGWRKEDYEIGVFSNFLKDAFLETEDRNVIVIDCKTDVSTYTCALSQLKRFGGIGARFVDVLVKKHGANLSTFHVMGHRVGSHIAGFVGKKVKSGRLPRITGLDPMDHLISCSDKNNCLFKTDGEFVDVIHTNEHLEVSDPLGHVDFYPNGGLSIWQPFCGINADCSFSFYREAMLSGENGLKFTAARSHSYEEFKKGICTAKNELGPNAKKEPQGKYYFTTRSYPYAQGIGALGTKCLASLAFHENNFCS